jgi:AcrR family transcriptional regulator
MARRSDHTAEELKTLAIDKAIEIIDTSGIAGLSARRVTAAMGYTVGTLYHAFGDLDTFLLHVNGRILDDWHDDLRTGMKRSRKDPLQFLVDSYLAYARQHRDRWVMLFSDGDGDTGRAMPPWYAEKVSRLFYLLESALRPHLAAGDDPAETAKLLWASIHGICVLSLTGKLDVAGVNKPEKLIAALLARILRK